ncbi:SapB/AmfS family lanthipeptide [Allorhizocola rhizosphaerae]|nr:SapB/AmfS family lanthipeptide [Allorhizocola rhizosphaerae]
MALLDLQALDARPVPTGHPFSEISLLLCPSENSIHLCWRSELSVTLCA